MKAHRESGNDVSFEDEAWQKNDGAKTNPAILRREEYRRGNLVRGSAYYHALWRHRKRSEMAMVMAAPNSES